MNQPKLTNDACPTDRIEQFLNNRLSPDEEREFESHLDSCETCRRQLETTAAEIDVWSGVRESLSSTEVFAAESTDRDVDVEISNTGYQQSILNLLSPADDERMLGRLGTYEVTGVIGSGGNGVVLKALDPALNRYVAIKILAPHLGGSGAARKRFAREAQAAAAIVHENVMEIYGVDDVEGFPYLVMPYMRGPSLQKRLDEKGPLELNEILRIAMQTSAGLAAAHAQGLVHRDVKPANIMLADGVERVKLSDFGLARAADDATLTRTGIIAGTPQYMSPEQARGESVDQRSDLFSLGSVMYTMCTGRAPFRAETSYGVLRRITDESPTPIRELNPDIPAWLCGIIQRLMSRQPEDRFSSAHTVSELLENCLAHVQQPTQVALPEAAARQESNLVASEPAVPTWRKSMFKYPSVIATIAIGLLGVLGLGVVATNPQNINGKWYGEDWGVVQLSESTKPGHFSGTYTFEGEVGKIELKWSRAERRYVGKWNQGEKRFGKISVRRVHNDIRGAWTTSKKSTVEGGTPKLADLLWERQTDKTRVQLNTKGPLNLNVGDQEFFSVQIKNDETTPIHNLEVICEFDKCLDPRTGTSGLLREGDILTWRNLGRLDSGETKTIEVGFRAVSSARDATVTFRIPNAASPADSAKHSLPITAMSDTHTPDIGHAVPSSVGIQALLEKDPKYRQLLDRIDERRAQLELLEGGDDDAKREAKSLVRDMQMLETIRDRRKKELMPRIRERFAKDENAKLTFQSDFLNPPTGWKRLFRKQFGDRPKEIAVSSDGRAFAISTGALPIVFCNDGRLYTEKEEFEDALKIELKSEFPTPTTTKVFENITDLALAPDANFLVIGNEIGQVHLCDLGGGLIATLEDYKGLKSAGDRMPGMYRDVVRALGWVTRVRVSPDGKYIAACGGSFMDDHEKINKKASIVRREDLAKTGHEFSRVKVWDAESHELIWTAQTHARDITFSQDSKRLYAVGAFAGVQISANVDSHFRPGLNGIVAWNSKTGKVELENDNASLGHCRHMAIHDQLGIISSESNGVKTSLSLFDLQSNNPKWVHASGPSVERIEISKNGRNFYVLTPQTKDHPSAIYVRSVESGDIVAKFSNDEFRIRDFDVVANYLGDVEDGADRLREVIYVTMSKGDQGVVEAYEITEGGIVDPLSHYLDQAKPLPEADTQNEAGPESTRKMQVHFTVTGML